MGSANHRERLIDWCNLTAIPASSLVFALLRWGKLNSLVHDDPAMWLSQVARAARGELVYRDFSWNYPPFSMWVFSAFLRFFGVTFTAAQAAVDLLSLAIVLLSYWLVRLTLPRVLHFPVVLLLIATGATAQTKFTLFSFLTYSPSLHTATIGLLLMMIGTILYLRAGCWSGSRVALTVVGAFIAQTSKPESFLASLALLSCIAIFGPGLRWTMAAGCLLPAIAAYALEAHWVGLGNFTAGLSGYGLATIACPWWPTGLGLYGAAASLAQAVLLAAIATVPLRREFLTRYGKRYRTLLMAAIPCGVFYLSYYAYLSQDELTSGHALLYKLKQVLPLLFWTSPVLLPVMWVGILYCCRYVFRRGDRELFLILVVPTAMSVRSLFGTTLYPYTEVSAMCYAFFLLAGPLLLWKFLAPVASPAKAALVVAGFVLFYCGVRLIGGYSVFLSNRDYHTLETAAGPIRLHGDDGSADIYRYVMDHTSPIDTVLDIPYGGGINLAANRASPAFTTEFEQLRPTKEHQQRDLDILRRRSPKVILADDKPAYGVVYGWPQNMGCPCPRLVWQPDQPAGDPSYTFPLTGFIAENYRVERKIGTKLILVPKAAQ